MVTGRQLAPINRRAPALVLFQSEFDRLSGQSVSDMNDVRSDGQSNQVHALAPPRANV